LSCPPTLQNSRGLRPECPARAGGTRKFQRYGGGTWATTGSAVTPSGPPGNERTRRGPMDWAFPSDETAYPPPPGRRKNDAAGSGPARPGGPRTTSFGPAAEAPGARWPPLAVLGSSKPGDGPQTTRPLPAQVRLPNGARAPAGMPGGGNAGAIQVRRRGGVRRAARTSAANGRNQHPHGNKATARQPPHAGPRARGRLTRMTAKAATAADPDGRRTGRIPYGPERPKRGRARNARP